MGTVISTDPTTVLPAPGPAADYAPSPTDHERLLRRPAPVIALAITMAALAFTSYATVPSGVIAAFMSAVLVVLAATDLERRVIPNQIVLPAIGIVLIIRLALFPDQALVYVLAALAAGIAFLVPNLINSSLMGMGDVKLVVLLGAGLGWGVVGAIAIAFLALFPFALATLVRGGAAARKATLPFGPFLALGAIMIIMAPRLIPGAGA